MRLPTKIGRGLVVGAGIGGIRAALDLAETGVRVTLIDRSPYIGGILTQLDHQFPSDRCGMCRMLPLMDRDAGSQQCLRRGFYHDNIEILPGTELAELSGDAGNFTASLRGRPALVDPSRCIGCGACAEVCPISVPDPFNAGLSQRKAIYSPVPHAACAPYVIDTDACNRCGACLDACPTGAIRLMSKRREAFRILVVDDEQIVRDSLKEWLHEEEGFGVETAASGPDALKKMEAAESPYRLMLLDIKMPEMDGVEALRRAKEIDPEICVVMMTAYAAVDTAVEAMKIGALDYLIKPFETDVLIPRIVSIYGDLDADPADELLVGAVVLCGGTRLFSPAQGRNLWGHGVIPNVVTAIEFERLLSGTGPLSGGPLVRADGKPVERIAWMQCVGSRNLQIEADFCSSICCMFALKQAMLAKEKSGGQIDASIFYMDLRTYGKPYQQYRDKAEEMGVKFRRARVHSIFREEKSGDLIVRNSDYESVGHDDHFDMAVLSAGHRPMTGMAEMAEMLDIPLNPWGYMATKPLSLTRTEREGIFIGGSFGGIMDINETLIRAGAAANRASRVIHSAGGGLGEAVSETEEYRDVASETPRIMAALCNCFESNPLENNPDAAARLKADPEVAEVRSFDALCTEAGWNGLCKRIRESAPNRVLVGACLPFIHARRLKSLARETGLDPVYMEAVDIRGAGLPRHLLSMAIERLKRVEPEREPALPNHQRALVIGGGIAGMTAALAIADHGFPVDLVESSDKLGGNLNWLERTIEGETFAPLLEEMSEKVTTHPKIEVRTSATVIGASGEAGDFVSVIETAEAGPETPKHETLEHGAVILAVGGREAETTAYGHGTSDAVVTQKELETRLKKGEIDIGKLGSVVMIQCVGSREAPRNYCSRVCCAASLKHALRIREENPETAVYVLYRDMMAYGFIESYYTRARRAGVIFISYEVTGKPEVEFTEAGLIVKVHEPVIGRPLEIETDLLVLATGITPDLPPELAAGYGAKIDINGFFEEADAKWRPVDALKEGVFACGLTQAPRSVPETIATAEAAAHRVLRILCRPHLTPARITAKVRHAYCARCGQCIDACPYGARTLNPETDQIIIHPAMCQGCGACAAICPNSAAVLEGFTLAGMLAAIDAATEAEDGAGRTAQKEEAAQ